MTLKFIYSRELSLYNQVINPTYTIVKLSLRLGDEISNIIRKNLTRKKLKTNFQY